MPRRSPTCALCSTRSRASTALTRLDAFAQVTPDLVDAVLDGAAKLAGDVLAPLNRSGDIAGCVLENGIVRTPRGFKEAYARYVEGGWNEIALDAEHGGQGLPHVARHRRRRDVVERQHQLRALPHSDDERRRAADRARHGASRSGSICRSSRPANGPAR